MDEMNIISQFTTNLISKLIVSVIRKNLGYNIGVKLNSVKVTINNGRAHLHLDADAEADSKELEKILSRFIG